MPSSITRHRLRLVGASAIAVALAASAAGGAYALTGGSSNASPKPGAVLAATASPPATATSVTDRSLAPTTEIDLPATVIPSTSQRAATPAASDPTGEQSAVAVVPTTETEVLDDVATPAAAPTRTPRAENTEAAATNTVAPQPTPTPTSTAVPALTTYNMGVRNPNSTCCDGADVGETFTLQAYIDPRCDGACLGPVAYQAAEWHLSFNAPTITLVSATTIVPGCTSELDGANGVRITCGDEQQTMTNTGYTFILVFRCDQPGLMIYSPQSTGTRVLVDGQWRPGYLNSVKDFQNRHCAPATPTP